MIEAIPKDPLQPVLDLLRQALQSGDLTLSTLEQSGGVLLHAPSEQLVTLNETGCCVLLHLQQADATLASTVDAVVARFEVEHADAERDCRLFLQRLHDVLRRR